MNQHPTTESHRTSPSAPRRVLDLDALAARDVDGLGELYAKGTVSGVGALEGRPTGRMLAVRGLDRGGIASTLRSLSAARAFPWGGKSFFGHGETGSGVNRIHGLGRHQLFPFVTRVASSVIDGRPCIALDYDLPDNPSFIRAIHDEVREVDAGLYLGPAMWKTAREPKFLLWFALDTLVPAAPFGADRARS